MQTFVLQKKPRFRFLFIIMVTLTFLPVFFCLALIQARWYGWVAATLALALLLLLRGRPCWHGWRTVLCYVGALLFAFAGVWLARPAWDEPLYAQIAGGLVRAFSGSRQLLANTILANDTNSVPPDGYEYHIAVLPHSRLEMLTRTDSDSRYAVLQLHGGAFVAGMNDTYRAFALRYSKLFDDCLVASLDYRLAPDYPYPIQQGDTLDAWAYLTGTLNYAADHIIVVGDSAGGNLALSLGLRLRDENRPMPLGFVCMSPWADLSNSGASHVYNATKDPSFGIPEADFYGQAVGVDSTYADGLDATAPYLSPSFGDYDGFPPMLIQAGSIEVLLSDSEMVYDNAKSHGVDCTLTVYQGMFHVFQGALDLLKPSRLAWAEVGQFMQRLLAQQE